MLGYEGEEERGFLKGMENTQTRHLITIHILLFRMRQWCVIGVFTMACYNFKKYIIASDTKYCRKPAPVLACLLLVDEAR